MNDPRVERLNRDEAALRTAVAAGASPDVIRALSQNIASDLRRLGCHDEAEAVMAQADLYDQPPPKRPPLLSRLLHRA